MKVVIVTCFESNEERVRFIAETFANRKDEVDIITTSFSHKEKKQRNEYPKFLESGIKIHTKPYNKNLSIDRLFSHYMFAKDAFIEIEKINPDLVWVVAPCHSLIKQANIYKTKNPNKKLIIDIIDMWPESLPIRINKYTFPLNIWRNVRSNNVKCADSLVVECDLYKDILKDEYNGKINSLYWARDSKPIITKCLSEELSLCYIGSINNIIDIQEICRIISSLKCNITLHIIGDGESKDELIQKTSNISKVEYHGVIYDTEEKKKIIEKCHAGLNIYRDDLYIGLTVKSIDYLQFGLPIINNIKGDTWNLVNKYKVGFNTNYTFSGEDIINMRNNNKHIYDVYENNFTKENFVKTCNNIINEVIK